MNSEVFERSLRERAAKRRDQTGLVDDSLAVALDETAAAAHDAREAMEKQMASVSQTEIKQ